MGYSAREFDKIAPEPGVDWTGDQGEWLLNASAKGWVTKTGAADAKAGALIIGHDYPTGVWVGIVRTVGDDKVSYETLDDKGKKIVLTKDYALLKTVLLGYIWPEKLSAPKRQKIVLSN
jgi:hypothetical protein